VIQALNLLWSIFPIITLSVLFFAIVGRHSILKPLDSMILSFLFLILASIEIFTFRTVPSPFAILLGSSFENLPYRLQKYSNELVLLVFCVSYIFVLTQNRKKIYFFNSRFLIFFIVALTSSILVSGWHENFWVNHNFLMSALSLILLIMICKHFSFEDLIRSLRTAIRYSLILSLISLIISPDWAMTSIWIGGISPSFPRYQGVMVHPNVFGITCTALIVCETYLRSKRSRLWIVLAMISILGTGSRASIVASIAVLIITRYPTFFSSKTILNISTYSLISVGILIPWISANFLTFRPRFLHYQESKELWQTSPLIGVGPFPKNELGNSVILYPHNQFWYFLSLGGITLTAVFILLIIKSKQCLSEADNFGSLTFFYVFLIYCSFDNYFRVSNSSFLLLAIIALISLRIPINESEPLRGKRTKGHEISQ